MSPKSENVGILRAFIDYQIIDFIELLKLELKRSLD